MHPLAYDINHIRLLGWRIICKYAVFAKEVPMNDKTVTEKTPEKMKAQIPITGMTCVNCVATIEKGLSDTEGVESVNVNLASEKATVEYDPTKIDLGKIKKTISELGY